MSNPQSDKQSPDATQTDNNQAELAPSLEEQLATSEKRRKDTQAGYTVGQQKIKALEAEREALLEQLGSVTKVTLTADDQERLDNLKYEDPEAWRNELNKLEKKSKFESRENLDKLTSEARNSANSKFEVERRQQVLSDYNASAEIPITDELIANDVPPRITNKLAEGKVTFEEFLSEVTTYLGKGKAVGNPDTLSQPNMGKIVGGNTPTDTKAETSLSDSYANDVY